jgi:DNA-binding NarL/FixJ family response regulator
MNRGKIKVGLVESEKGGLSHLRLELRKMQGLDPIDCDLEVEPYFFHSNDMSELDVIIIDVDGLKLRACYYTESVKRSFPDIKVLWSFQHNDPDNHFHSCRSGADDCIHYQADVDALTTVLYGLKLDNWQKPQPRSKRKSRRLSKVFFGF